MIGLAVRAATFAVGLPFTFFLAIAAMHGSVPPEAQRMFVAWVTGLIGWSLLVIASASWLAGRERKGSILAFALVNASALGLALSSGLPLIVRPFDLWVGYSHGLLGIGAVCAFALWLAAVLSNKSTVLPAAAG